MRAGVVFVPLDLHMTPDAIRRIADRSGALQLVIGTGRDAPDPAEADLDHLPVATTTDLCAEPGAAMPADWEAQVASWERPRREDVYLLIYTSGTTGTPKGVVLTHDNTVAGIDAFHAIVPDIEYRLVSLLPMSHLYAAGGRALPHPRPRRRHPLRPEPEPARRLRGDRASIG